MAATTAVVGSAALGALSANKAAKTQANAANNAADAQTQAAAQMRQDLSPYASLGQSAINPLWAAMGYTTNANDPTLLAKQQQVDQYKAAMAANPWWDQAQAQEQLATYQKELDDAQGGARQIDPNSTLQQKFGFDASNLDQTPGYQFALSQGLKSTNNALASQGLGLSGAQAKGLSNFATGLADQTYGNQYNRALSTYNTNYQVAANNVSNLQNLVNTGQNSAAQTGQAGLAAANNAGNYLTQAANASASGTVGTANALSNGVNNYMLYNALYK